MSTNHREGGYTFEFNEPAESTELDKLLSDPRDSKTFAIDDDVPNTIPEAITSNERLPNVSQLSSFRLEALPIKGLKVFFYAALALVVVISLFEIIRVYHYALNLHVGAAYAFIGLLVLVSLLGIRVVLRYLNDSENLAKLVDIQEQADKLLEGNDFGKSKDFIKALRTFYQNKPQEELFDRCLKEMPDYSNDKEVIQHIETTFLKPLDEEATRRVSTHCMQTGVAVAISPWASLDMLLSLWRSVKMIDEVAQVYGVRPSLPNRVRLLRRVLHQLLFVGVTELMTESLLAEFGFQGITSSLSARAGQGIGAGFYSAKIGIAAMKVSRPIAFDETNKPKMSTMAKGMVSKVTGLFRP